MTIIVNAADPAHLMPNNTGSIREARDRYVKALLAFEDAVDCTFPNISRLGEIDVALALGIGDEAVRLMNGSMATNQPGHDLQHEGVRYQVKARRMGRRGNIAHVFQFRSNRDFDRAVFVMYSPRLEVIGMVAVEHSILQPMLGPRGRTSWGPVRRIGRALL
jgi:hypothetical protein